MQEDVNLNGEYVEIDPSGSGEVKIDFCGHELTVAGDGDLYIGGGNVSIENGTIVVDGEEAFAAIVVDDGNVTLSGVEISASNSDGFMVAPIVSSDQANVTVEDCVIDAGDDDAPIFVQNPSSFTPSTDSGVTIVSGQFVGSVDFDEESHVKKVNDSTELSNDDAKGLVITSKDTAAVVVDEDGKAKLYDDLADAVEASDGAAVVVTDQSALEKLEVKEGDKLNLVDASGNKLNDKVNLGSDLILNADGTVAAKPIVRPVDPGTWEPVGPIEPIRPGEIEIDDPDTPLSGFPITLAPEDKLTRGMLMSILYQMDSAPAAKLASFIDVAADSDYAEAIGWASANGIAKGVGGNKFAPNDAVTRGQLVTFLNRYAAYVGSDVTVELNGDANEIVTWAVAEEIINDFFARLYA